MYETGLVVKWFVFLCLYTNIYVDHYKIYMCIGYSSYLVIS